MIPFTQYMLPNGRRVSTEIDRPPEVEAQAEKVLALGGHVDYAFESEVLTNGMVSLTLADRIEGVDVLIELCPNDLAVPDAVDRLVGRAFAMLEAGELSRVARAAYARDRR